MIQATDVIRELDKEADSMENWSDLEAHFRGREDLFAATRLVVAETLRRVAIAIRRAEET